MRGDRKSVDLVLGVTRAKTVVFNERYILTEPYVEKWFGSEKHMSNTWKDFIIYRATRTFTEVENGPQCGPDLVNPTCMTIAVKRRRHFHLLPQLRLQ